MTPHAALRTSPPGRARRAAIAAVALAAVAGCLGATTPAQALGTVAAQWPASTVRIGTSIFVTGHATAVPAGSDVLLERRVPGGWNEVARARLDSGLGYRFRIPTWWLGVRAYRVRTTAEAGGVSAWRVFNVTPNYRPPGYASQYRWAPGAAARWNPCVPIGYRVNPTQGGAGALADARAAFVRLGQASGLRFAYRGTTTRVPQYGGNSWYPADTQIVVAWARRHQSSLFGLYPGAVGVGAALSSSGWYNGDGSRMNRISKGMVVIDSAKRVRGGFGVGLTRGEVLLHELGHAVGLGHHSASSQLMYPWMTNRAASYGLGDLRALWLRGARMGCLYQSATGLSTSTATLIGAMR
jgi:hypothetical protein